ncbi:MAG TPA: DUF4445 domain-containing protein, partial [Candidatus Blautia avistercoris]|nr:DUF4445 domain-containing protein [Candidatus Blautia avistercoris]
AVMTRFCEKLHLQLTPPSGDDTLSDQERIQQALQATYGRVFLSLSVLQSLSPLCAECNWDLTVTLVETYQGWHLTKVQPYDTTSSLYGLAVDLGSTTVAMDLVNLNTGKIEASVRGENKQVPYGDDILTRIIYGKEDPQRLQNLQKAAVSSIEKLLDEITRLSGIPAKESAAMIISGNTTMIHFLLNLNPWPIFMEPNAPVACDPGYFYGKELGMDFPGMIYLVPAIANYLGGDITSGLLTTDFYKKDQLSVFFDIGTNGELVLGNSQFLLAGAGAAGPALEGGISQYGMRAADGAIDSVSIHKETLSFTTIGEEKPRGICGSGIIDLMAQMRINGWIDITGTLNPNASPRIVFDPESEEYVVVYALPGESQSGKALFFSQTDILQYLDTKAAAHTMVDCLLEAAGIEEDQIQNYYTAGAFGTYANLESAITVGIFPDLPRKRFHCLSNSSLAGARLLLLDKSKQKEIAYLRKTIYYFQFASQSDFLVKMQAAKFIPHTDTTRYPTVMEKLKESPS